jgi:tetratricopeptide (TPR) repeat protein
LFPAKIDRREFLCAGSKAALMTGLLTGGASSLVTACSSSAKPPQAANTAEADSLFNAGKFSAADAIYRQALAAYPDDLHALTQHAWIAMLSNQLDEARDLFTSALRRQPGNKLALAKLAATLFRLDDFARAEPVYRRLGLAPTADWLASFGDLVPYEIHGPETTSLPLVTTGPIAQVNISVNGSRPVPVNVDTGAPFALDPGFAASAGVTQTAPEGLGRADSITLGDLEIRNVPVQVNAGSMSVRTGNSGSRYARRRDSSGPIRAIGTSLLSHFLFTIDYADNALVLRQKTAAQLQSQAGTVSTVPFWVTETSVPGVVIMVAWARLESSLPVLCKVDTGGTLAFSADDAIATAARDKLDYSKAQRSVVGLTRGMPNYTTTIPFTVHRLALGNAVSCNLPAIAEGNSQDSETGEMLGLGFAAPATISQLFFSPFAVTFDFHRMTLTLSGDAGSCRPDRPAG